MVRDFGTNGPLIYLNYGTCKIYHLPVFAESLFNIVFENKIENKNQGVFCLFLMIH